MSQPRDVAQVLAHTGPILLDFDGPVCSVFGSLTNRAVADRLRQVLARHTPTVPSHLTDESDPLELLRYAATLGDPRIVLEVDDELRRGELQAVTGAAPTPHSRDLLANARQASRPLAIVSNNSAPAVSAYLAAHRLTDYVEHVVGRPRGEPWRMKPSTDLVLAALRSLAVEPARSVLIGDSTADIHAGRDASVHTIGFANRPGKTQRLLDAGADAVVEGADGMGELARLLQVEAAEIGGR